MGKIKKVCIVGAGGFGRETFIWLQAASGNDSSVFSKTVVFLESEVYSDDMDIMGAPVILSNEFGFINRTWLFLKYTIAGIRLALSDDYDLLFATSTPLTVGIPGIVAKIFRRKRFIFEVRDLWPELPREMGVVTNPVILKLMDWLETVTFRSADKCIALAPGIADVILKKMPEKQVIVIPNGSDDVEPKTYSTDSGNNKFVAVFTGAHGIANGLNAVLDTAGELLRRNENGIEIQFIGDGKLKPELMDRAEREGLYNCVFWEPIPKQKLFDYLKENADVGLMILDNIPVFYNGTSPNKFFDYISLGLPVINNYPGWLADMIKDNCCGVALAPGDSAGFADALVFLKEDFDARKKYGENARKLSEGSFNRKLLSENFVKFLIS